MDGFSKLFKFFFVSVFAIIVTVIAASAFLGVKCYLSGDPNSMACYMMSDRYEVGIRERK